MLKQAYAVGEYFVPRCLSSNALGMTREDAKDWEENISCLWEAGIELSDSSDKMLWIGNNQMGTITTKLAYLSLFKHYQMP